MTKIGVISDTHGILDDKIINFLSICDEIWHAGDIGSLRVLDQLEKMKPLKAVYGNIDDHKIRTILPEINEFRCENKNILITHIGLIHGTYDKKILDNLLKKKTDIFICGHSHILKIKYLKEYDCLHINPGACGKSGLHKFRTAVRFNINNDKVDEMEILEIPR